MVMSEVRCVCDLCAIGIQQDKMCYIGVQQCFKNGVYTKYKSRTNNPPLKFEDLHEGMWIWDDKTKSYIYIFKPLEWEPVRGIRYASHIITNSVEGYYMDLEENRFYRREVPQEGQENE